jgi:hypothetical protein
MKLNLEFLNDNYEHIFAYMKINWKSKFNHYIKYLTTLTKSELLNEIEGWHIDDWQGLKAFILSINDLQSSIISNKLKVYQEICLFMINDKPSTIIQCQIRLSGHYMNIYDYLNKENVDRDEVVFTDFKSFRKRCKKIGYFPKEKAKSENFKVLLQRLF